MGFMVAVGSRGFQTPGVLSCKGALSSRFPMKSWWSVQYLPLPKVLCVPPKSASHVASAHESDIVVLKCGSFKNQIVWGLCKGEAASKLQSLGGLKR